MTTPSAPKLKAIDLWQHRLLPVMVIAIVVLAIFFFSASIYQLLLLNEKIESGPGLTNAELLAKAETTNSFAEYQWKTLVLLESHTLQQRYHQANVLLMARTWVRYLGFVSGMVLAFIGSIFILGKLKESPSELSLEQTSLKVTLATHSPGIVLSVLGVVLMLVTIVVHQPIDVRDGPNYTNFMAIPPQSSRAAPPVQLSFGKSVQTSGEPAMDLNQIIEQGRDKHGLNSQATP